MDELMEELYTPQFCVSPNIGLPPGSNLPRSLCVTFKQAQNCSRMFRL